MNVKSNLKKENQTEKDNKTANKDKKETERKGGRGGLNEIVETMLSLLNKIFCFMPFISLLT
jgi:hypothetical protein